MPSFFPISSLKFVTSYLHTYGISLTVRKIRDYLAINLPYQSWFQKEIQNETYVDETDTEKGAVSMQISILVPVFRTDAVFLKQLLESVCGQSVANWELCIADGSADPAYAYIPELIRKYQKRQGQGTIRYIQLEKNLGIAGNTNAALALATGDYIALLDHDDILAPNALMEITREIRRDPSVDVLYTDEDKINLTLTRHSSPYFKPDFDLDLLRSCNYITHFYVVRRKIAREVGGFSTESNGSQDYDFILKTCEKATLIRHIPKVLYHWRVHPASVAGDPESKNYAYDAALHALESHLERCGEAACVRSSSQYGFYQVSYELQKTPKVTVCLMHCDASLAEDLKMQSRYPELEVLTDADHLSEAEGEYLLFLSHVRRILTPDYLQQLLSNCQRPGIGIACGRACMSVHETLEAGLYYSADGQLHSPYYRLPVRGAGYCSQALSQHQISLASPFCMMVKTEDFMRYYDRNGSGSFRIKIYHFCNLMRSAGKHITWLPSVQVLCSCRKVYYPLLQELVGQDDPYYNPNLSVTHPYHLKEKETVR